MKGDALPKEDHITRLCGGSHITEAGEPRATAFFLKPKDSGSGLSVNWLEHLGLPSRAAEITEIRRIMAEKFMKGVGSTAILAVLNVGQALSSVREESADNRELAILHEPSPRDPSHSGIHNYTIEEELIAELLAGCVLDIYPAKEE
jgi:hypothetical protein